METRHNQTRVNTAIESRGTGPESARRPWVWAVLDFLVPIAILLSLTALLAPLDVDLERPHFDEMSGFGARDGFWGWLYQWGPVPAVVATLLAIAVAIFGLKNRRLSRWRRVCVFVILVGAMGPGVITNALLKEYWGRPRPREIVEFDGRYQFERVLTIDRASPGKSFPCGHATMGYFFFVGYFIFRRWRNGLAIAFLIGGLSFGGLLSYMRMIQGGHFATDGLWAGGVMFFVSAGLFHWLGLNRQLFCEAMPPRKTIPVWGKIGGGLLVVLAIGAVLLGTPYSAKRQITPLEAASSSKPLRISVRILKGDIKVSGSEEFFVIGKAWGHGVPTSQIAEKFREEVSDAGESMRIKYQQRSSGFFTESGQTLEIGVPWKRAKTVELTFGEGEVEVTLEDVYIPQRIDIGIQKETDFVLILPEKTPVWCTDEVAKALGVSDLVIVSQKKPRREGDGLIELRLSNEFAE